MIDDTTWVVYNYYWARQVDDDKLSSYVFWHKLKMNQLQGRMYNHMISHWLFLLRAWINNLSPWYVQIPSDTLPFSSFKGNLNISWRKVLYSSLEVRCHLRTSNNVSVLGKSKHRMDCKWDMNIVRERHVKTNPLGLGNRTCSRTSTKTSHY